MPKPILFVYAILPLIPGAAVYFTYWCPLAPLILCGCTQGRVRAVCVRERESEQPETENPSPLAWERDIFALKTAHRSGRITPRLTSLNKLHKEFVSCQKFPIIICEDSTDFSPLGLTSLMLSMIHFVPDQRENTLNSSGHKESATQLTSQLSSANVTSCWFG